MPSARFVPPLPGTTTDHSGRARAFHLLNEGTRKPEWDHPLVLAKSKKL